MVKKGVLSANIHELEPCKRRSRPDFEGLANGVCGAIQMGTKKSAELSLVRLSILSVVVRLILFSYNGCAVASYAVSCCGCLGCCFSGCCLNGCDRISDADRICLCGCLVSGLVTT